MRNKILMHTIIITFLLVTIGGWFYWFEYRVYMIKKDCSDNLLAKSAENRDYDLYNNLLTMCINSGGYEHFGEIIKANRKN